MVYYMWKARNGTCSQRGPVGLALAFVIRTPFMHLSSWDSLIKEWRRHSVEPIVPARPNFVVSGLGLEDLVISRESK